MNASTLYLAQGERGREMSVALSKLLVQTLSVEYIHTHIHTYIHTSIHTVNEENVIARKEREGEVYPSL